MFGSAIPPTPTPTVAFFFPSKEKHRPPSHPHNNLTHKVQILRCRPTHIPKTGKTEFKNIYASCKAYSGYLMYTSFGEHKELLTERVIGAMMPPTPTP